MIKQVLIKGDLYINYLGPLSAILGNLIATPILISNLGLNQWSLFALINILLPLVYLNLFGSSEIVRRMMINIFLVNKKIKKSIDLFFKYEKKIFIRFFPAIFILSIILISFNSNSYSSFKKIEFTFFFISVAVLIKMFEFYYSELLNGLKQHYKLHIYGFVVTFIKWSTIIYLSFLSEVNINTLIITMIIFSFLMIIIQRILILNFFQKIQKKSNTQDKEFKTGLIEKKFGITIFLLLLIQHFNKILAFGYLDSNNISYFGIALMLSSAIPLIITPIIVYLTPEIYETSELSANDRKEKFSYLLVNQLFIMTILLVITNLFLDSIIALWIQNNINYTNISLFFIPLSISTLSISMLTSLKILFIAENKLNYMWKPLVLVFIMFIFFTMMMHLQVITVEIYLYCLSISKFILGIYFSIIYLKKI